MNANDHTPDGSPKPSPKQVPESAAIDVQAPADPTPDSPQPDDGVRLERVADLRQAIEAGKYAVSADDLAESILRSMRRI